MPSPKNSGSNKGGSGSKQALISNDKATAAAAGGGGTTTNSNKKSTTTAASASVVSSTNGLLDYLQVSLPRKTLLSLYIEDERGRFVVRAVIQQLSLVSQQIIMRLHCTGGSFPLSGIQLWIVQTPNTQQSQQHSVILKELYKWAIIQENSTTMTDVTLTVPFATGLRSSLSSLDSSPWVPLTIQQIESIHKQYQETTKDYTKKLGTVPTLDDLEKYTQLQWDTVLHFLVGTEGKKDPPGAVVHFLLETNLMRPDPEAIAKTHITNPDDAPLVITTKGYDFMLQDSYKQIWHFIVQYLHSIEQHPKGEDLLREALLLLICLTFARPGCPYAASSLKKDCRSMIKDLSLFGLLYTMKVGKTTIFYPTRLAIQLVGHAASSSSSSSGGSSSTTNSASSVLWSASSKVLEASLTLPDPSGSSHLAIIVQTNFQLAAYTTSELHVSMLGLFCDVGTIRRLPNVVFMQITRDSVKSAFALGIKAQQILRFLEKHTHPKLRTNTFDSPVPGNVVDQIWLWDRELHRVSFIKVYQHQCVMGTDEFKAVHQYSLDKGYYTYSIERKQLLLLDYKHLDRIQAFVRQWRAQSISRQKG